MTELTSYDQLFFNQLYIPKIIALLSVVLKADLELKKTRQRQIFTSGVLKHPAYLLVVASTRAYRSPWTNARSSF